MDIKDIDCRDFRFDPTSDDDRDKMIEAHPEFSEDLGELNSQRDKVLRYIILFYDKNTPLRYEYPDINKRKINAALMAGFKPVGNRFEDCVRDLLIGQNEAFNAMAVKYMMLFDDPRFLSLHSYLHMFVTSIQNSFKTKDDKELSNINKNIESLEKKISFLTEEIFGGKESSKMEQMLYESLDFSGVSLRPEDVADRLSKGERGVNIELY